MHLVGLIIRIYHDARPPERQVKKFIPQSGPEPWSSRPKSITIMTQLSRQMLRTFHRPRRDARINLGLQYALLPPDVHPLGTNFRSGRIFFVIY